MFSNIGNIIMKFILTTEQLTTESFLKSFPAPFIPTLPLISYPRVRIIYIPMSTALFQFSNYLIPFCCNVGD